MYGRKDLHEIDPDEISDEENDFHSILEYLANEATRSKVLITSTRQGKVINEFCLQAHAYFIDKGSHFTMVIEPIYKMAVIQVVADSESIEQILMPLINQYQDTIAEVEIYQWTNEEKVVLIFIDNVFEEVVGDDVLLLFEHDKYAWWGNELANYRTKERSCDLELYADEYEVDTLEDDRESKKPVYTTNIKEFLEALIPKKLGCLIDYNKIAIVQNVYLHLRRILDRSEATYTIEFIDKGDNFCGLVAIQIVTDAFEPSDQNDTIKSYRYVINNVNSLSQNTYGRKIVMTFSIDDVFIELRSNYDNDNGDDSTGYEDE